MSTTQFCIWDLWCCNAPMGAFTANIACNSSKYSLWQYLSSRWNSSEAHFHLKCSAELSDRWAVLGCLYRCPESLLASLSLSKQPCWLSLMYANANMVAPLTTADNGGLAAVVSLTLASSGCERTLWIHCTPRQKYYCKKTKIILSHTERLVSSS